MQTSTTVMSPSPAVQHHMQWKVRANAKCVRPSPSSHPMYSSSDSDIGRRLGICWRATDHRVCFVSLPAGAWAQHWGAHDTAQRHSDSGELPPRRTLVCCVCSTLPPTDDARDGIALRLLCHMSPVSSRFFVWPLQCRHTPSPSHADCYCYWNLVAFFMGVTVCTHVTILCCR